MSQPTSLPGRLFRFVWNLVVGIYKLFVILFLVLSGVLLWLALRDGPGVKIENNVALVVAPTGVLVDQIDRDPSQAFFEDVAGEVTSQSTVRDMTQALENAAGDTRIAFAVLKLDGLQGASLPQLGELAGAMKTFQETGKKIVAYGAWYDQSHYFAASQADEIVMDPYGVVAIEGFSFYTSYFKDALDKLGVKINVFRVGEFKSAVEPFTRNDMSAEARAANLDWLGDLWQDYGQTVAAGRGLPETAASDYVGAFRSGLEAKAGDAAALALERKLVTHVETLREFRTRMAADVGVDDSHGSFRQVHYLDYLGTVKREKLRQAGRDKTRIALVVVQGEIVDGYGDVGYAGGDMVSELLDRARRDEDVAAVVLRVNSPGGSVWASEQIRRQVQHLRDEGKPVVASMGGVAASGGYWVSMDADQIFAHPSTVTGSIGIFGLVPTLDESLAKLGIRSDGVGTTSLAGALRLDRPLSEEMKAIIQAMINKGYADFINGVAAARELDVAEVDRIARGRVWSGQAALERGLVDSLGGLDAAAAAAAQLAELGPGEWVLEEFAPERSLVGRLLSRFSGSLGGLHLPVLAGWARDWLQQRDVERLLRAFNDPHGMYALCFCTPAADRPR